MTKAQAFAEANRRWFIDGPPNECAIQCAFVRRCRNAPRFRVGYYVNETDAVTHAGESDASWEAAFADADAKRAKKGE